MSGGRSPSDFTMASTMRMDDCKRAGGLLWLQWSEADIGYIGTSVACSGTLIGGPTCDRVVLLRGYSSVAPRGARIP